MPSLKSLLGTKNREIVEYNLEKGKIWTYGTSGMYNTTCNCGCWCAPGSGSVTLEVWGAGGSGARMCCCGMGVPGNSGAYSKKQFNVTQGIITCGTAGRSCGNSDSLCFRGCSESTQVCWRSSDSGANGCICSQGGRGGITFCTTGASPYCCFAANGFCATKLDNENCGLICNKCSGSFEAEAYGGDLNKPGTVSCSLFAECYANNTACGYTYHIAMPPGVLSKESSMITFSPEVDSVNHNWSGAGIHQFQAALNAASRNPTNGGFHHSCWMGHRACGCYEMQGCQYHVPVGTGGPPPNQCPGVRDGAWRGGPGGFRIKYIES
jgi:hypothetical protein